MKMRMVLKQPPPSFFAPYPAIKALSQLGIVKDLTDRVQKIMPGERAASCKLHAASKSLKALSSLLAASSL